MSKVWGTCKKRNKHNATMGRILLVLLRYIDPKNKKELISKKKREILDAS